MSAAGCTRSTAHDRRFEVIVSGDTAGWIVPCGCTSNQSGGFPRRATYIAAARRQAPVIALDAGGAPGGVSEYSQLKFAALLLGEAAMGVAVHNIGAGELALGEATLRAASSEASVPLVSANLADESGRAWFEPLKIVEVGSVRVAVIGVISPRYATAAARIKPPQAAILAALETVRGAYDRVVVLAYAHEEELTALAESLPEVDLVIGGPTGQSIWPRQVGPTWVASATNKGKFLAHFKFDGRDKPAWTGEIVELDQKQPDDWDQLANVKRFHELLDRRDLAAEQTDWAPVPTSWPAGYRVAGTEQCRQCHHDDCAKWEATTHASAWQTLIETGSHVDAACQHCHVTGFGLPGGFVSAKRSASQSNVSCESCHGPSQLHVQNPTKGTAFQGRAQQQCAVCHDEENSPQFEYATYWPRIEHGAAANAPGKLKSLEALP